MQPGFGEHSFNRMEEDSKFFDVLREKLLRWDMQNNKLVTICTEVINAKLFIRYIDSTKCAEEGASMARIRPGLSLEERATLKLQTKVLDTQYRLVKQLKKLGDTHKDIQDHVTFLKAEDHFHGIIRLGALKKNYASKLLNLVSTQYANELSLKNKLVEDVMCRHDRETLSDHVHTLQMEPFVQNLSKSI